MAQIKTKYNVGDEIYYLQQNIDCVTAIPRLRQLTIKEISLTCDGVSYTDYSGEPIPEEEAFSSLDEAIKFVTEAIRQSVDHLYDD